MNDGNVRRAVGERLAEAVERAVDDAPTPAALAAARDAANVVGLPGLDRLLAGLARLGRTRWPEETLAVRDRLQRLARDCRAERGIAPLERADADLSALAAEIEGIAWSPPEQLEPAMTLTLAEAIGPMAVDSSEVPIEEVRFTAPVGSALKAVRDWLAGEDSRLHLSVSAGALEMTVERPDAAALRASGRLLEAVGGSLMPSRANGNGTPAVWRVRVPTAFPGPTYLMVRQGKLALALPWHTVAGIHMAAGGGDQSGQLKLPRLAPLSPLARAGAQPVFVVVASGLRRACLVADRLIWRFAAVPHDGGEAPSAPLDGAVRTEEGSVYWVLNATRMLAGVPDATLDVPQDPAPKPARRAAETKSSDSARTKSEPHAVPAGAVEEALLELTAEDVEPLEPPAPDAATDLPPLKPPGAPEPTAVPPSAIPLSPTAPLPHASPQPSIAAPPPAPVRRKRALIADDALVARRFLTRMLEGEGFEVQAVARAADLLNALAQPWDMVLADVELPDGRGADLMKRVLDRCAPNGPTVIALVRDAADRQAARGAGVAYALRKPFDRETIVTLLGQLGLRAEPKKA